MFTMPVMIQKESEGRLYGKEQSVCHVNLIYMALIIAFLYVPIAGPGGACLSTRRDPGSSGADSRWNWYQGPVFPTVRSWKHCGPPYQSGCLPPPLPQSSDCWDAVGIDAMRKKGYSISVGAGNITLMNADIVTGIALMLWFARFFELGYTSVLLAHVTFCIPYVLLSILPKLRQLDVSVYEAARDLGAGNFHCVYTGRLPTADPGGDLGLLYVSDHVHG